MGTLVDLTGERFGRLEAIRVVGIDKRGEKIWECYCECGSFHNVLSSNLRTGHTKSCGCLDREKFSERTTKHGMYGTRTYKIYQNLLQRCYNEKSTFYTNYGARGIKVCKRWESFDNFLADMGEVPDGYQLDRINNDGDYEPGNVRWATPKDNARNRSSNVEITYNGKTQCIAAWEEELGFKYGTLWNRLNTYKWPVEKAMTEPVKNTSREPITFNGKTQSLAKHAKDHGLGATTVTNRISNGWTVEEALFIPKGGKRGK
jgi:hypothetical protein